MKILTEDAKVACRHGTGKVGMLLATQNLVTINGRKVLLSPDPLFKPIGGCANLGPTIKPCMLTTSVSKGYSAFVTINGRAICLDNLAGNTDGTPPGVIEYHVHHPGQTLVNVEA